jgi:hypothetical protein
MLGEIVPPSLWGPPTLEGSDGTFVAHTWTTGPQNAFYDTLLALSKAGNVSWQWQNTDSESQAYEESIDPADNVSVQLVTGTGCTSVNVGNPGTMTINGTPCTTGSWTGNSYMSSLTDALLAQSMGSGQLAQSFMAVPLGNPSKTSTHIQQQPFPPLVSCQPTASEEEKKICKENGWNSHTGGPRDIVKIALSGLEDRLQAGGACPGKQVAMFGKLGGKDANGNPANTSSFLSYLTSKTPEFYDGTTSNVLYSNVQCGEGWSTHYVYSWIQKIWQSCNGYSGSVSAFFASQNPDAITATPSYLLKIFFKPTALINVQNGSNSILSDTVQSLVYHEALHGYTGLTDEVILTDFGYPVIAASSSISSYLETNVLEYCPAP